MALLWPIAVCTVDAFGDCCNQFNGTFSDALIRISSTGSFILIHFCTTKKETVVIENVRWEKICNYTRRRCTTYREAAAQLPLLSRLRVCALCVDCDEIRTHTHTRQADLTTLPGTDCEQKKKSENCSSSSSSVRSFVHFSLSSVWLPAARQTKQTRLYIEPGLLITIQGVRHDIYTHTMCVCVCICRVMMRQRTL